MLQQRRDADRVGDSDRSVAIAVLGRALGYLDALEYSHRREPALAAHTRGDLVTGPPTYPSPCTGIPVGYGGRP